MAALRLGGSGWLVALSGGSAAAVFTLWRTVAGACCGLALLLAAAGLGWMPQPSAPLPPLKGLLVPLALVEVYGLATVAAVTLSRDPRRVSRRLLGCWLASTGLLVLGFSLCVSLPSRGVGSALVAAGLTWRVGAVPAYAWAPLLMRHPAPAITALGVGATLAAGALLLAVLPRLPHPGAAATTVAGLSAVTVPWALWHALRQWGTDRRCAVSYASVAAVAELLLVVSRSGS